MEADERVSIPRVAWRIVQRDGKPLVKMCCPGCGVWGDLGDHEIAADGTVMPSVICGNDGNVREIRVEPGSLVVEHQGDRTTPCTFHESVRLEGW